MKEKSKFAYDIAIIGLGPAGSTLARLLSPQYRVLCIDKKSNRPDSFQKPCGGLLSADAQKALASFRLTLPKDILVNPQIFSVKTMDLQNQLIRQYPRFYLNLDRHKFDLWLASLIPARIEIHSNAYCTALSRKNGGFSVTYREGAKN